MKEMQSMSSTLSIGRLSTGMKQTGPSAEKDRIGRFSTGMEKTGPSAEKDRIGRFSTGMEKTEATLVTGVTVPVDSGRLAQ